MTMTTTPMLRELTEYYDKMEILSTKFRCPNLAKCQGRLKPTCELPAVTAENLAEVQKNIIWTFTQAKSACVGQFYERAEELGIPRLMIVSSDPGGALYDVDRDWRPRENRTPQEVRRRRGAIKDRLPGRSGDSGNEMRNLARRILQEFGVNIDPLENPTPYYANVNAAKCCQNKRGKKEADARLFGKCRGYLRGEIDILSPDVIVTQGGMAKKGVEHAFGVSSEWGRELIVVLADGKKALLLPAYHPGARGGVYKKQRDEEWGPNWNRFAERVCEFMSGRDS